MSGAPPYVYAQTHTHTHTLTHSTEGGNVYPHTGPVGPGHSRVGTPLCSELGRRLKPSPKVPLQGYRGVPSPNYSQDPTQLSHPLSLGQPMENLHREHYDRAALSSRPVEGTKGCGWDREARRAEGGTSGEGNGGPHNPTPNQHHATRLPLPPLTRGRRQPSQGPKAKGAGCRPTTKPTKSTRQVQVSE